MTDRPQPRMSREQLQQTLDAHSPCWFPPGDGPYELCPGWLASEALALMAGRDAYRTALEQICRVPSEPHDDLWRHMVAVAKVALSAANEVNTAKSR